LSLAHFLPMVDSDRRPCQHGGPLSTALTAQAGHELHRRRIGGLDGNETEAKFSVSVAALNYCHVDSY